MQHYRENKNFDSQIATWDRLIKEGNVGLVQKEVLRHLSKSRLQRPQRLHIAKILRRIGAYDEAVRVLFPIVRPPPKKPLSAKPEELIEYASSLIQSGCLLEGRGLLQTVKAADHPARDLFLSFSYFAEWDYDSAVPLLKNYLASEKLNSYERLIGNINYFAALVATDKAEEAKVLLKTLKPQLKDSPYQLLYANCCEIEAQNSIRSGDFRQAEKQLANVKALFTNLGHPYALYWEKWTLVLKGKLSKDSAIKKKICWALKDLSARAADLHFSEVARDANYWEGSFTHDRELINFVYFGTPSDHYRKKIAKENVWFQPNYGSLRWPLNGKIAKTNNDLSWIYEKKQLPFRLLQILLSDFYRQWNRGSLFAKLYPDEYYNPDIAHQKISQLILRANASLKEARCALKVIRRERRIFLRTKKSFTFKAVQESRMALNQEQLRLTKFLEAIQSHPHLGAERWLSVREIHDGLRLPRRTCQALLQKAVTQNVLSRRGLLKSTKYKLVMT